MLNRAGLIDCDDGVVEAVAHALLAITPDPEKHVAEYFEEGDPELRQRALDALDESRQCDT